MRRPFLALGVAFGAGVFLSRQLLLSPQLPLCLALLCFPLSFQRGRRAFMIAISAAFFALGLARESMDRILPQDHISNQALSGKAVFNGKIRTSPEIKIKGRRRITSFELELASVERQGENRSVKGRVLVYGFNVREGLDYGDSVRIYAEAKPPKGAVNPGQFDYRRYLAQRKITRTLYAFGSRGIDVDRKGGPSLFGAIFHLRTWFKDVIDRTFPFPEREILAALVIGMRKQIPERIKEDYARTGTTHVLAVSGLNVSIVGGLVFLLFRLAGLPQKLNALLSLLFIMVYVVLSGGNPPVFRAGIMGVILMLGILIEKKSDLRNSLAFAFFLLLFLRPQNLFSADFQLSFLCVSAIAILVPRIKNECFIEEKGRRRAPSFWRSMLSFYQNIFLATVAATLGTFPLILYYFHLASPVSLIANVAIVPLVNLATFSGFLLLPLAAFSDHFRILTVIPLVAIKIALVINRFLASLPWASFYLPSPPVWVLGLYYSVPLLLPKRIKRPLLSRWGLVTVAVCAVILMLGLSWARRDDVLRIHVLSLKKGRVALLELPGRQRNILVNTGKGRPQDEWKWVIRPFLRSRGIQTLDAIYLTSAEARDTGGIEALSEEFQCPRVVLPVGVSRKLQHKLAAKGISVEKLLPGQRQELGRQTQIVHRRVENVDFLEINFAAWRLALVYEGRINLSDYDFKIPIARVPEAWIYEIDPRRGMIESHPMK